MKRILMSLIIGCALTAASYCWADSLWMPAETSAVGSMFADHRAYRIGDIITVVVVEGTTVSQKADSTRSRDSSIKGEVKDWSVPRLDGKLLKTLFSFDKPQIDTKVAGDDLPRWEIDTANEFKGGGTFTGNYSVRGQITTRIIEVLANNNLVVEGASEVLINKEKNMIAVSGIIRPEDISTNNSILSTQLADARVRIVSKGPLNDKTGRGIMETLMDWLWPF